MGETEATERDAQRDRAIRRAAESVTRVTRPADWQPADYRRFERTLRDNGYELVKVAEDGSDG
jgi:hypothetical protein